jgi:outer membrane protein assembly factor BamB
VIRLILILSYFFLNACSLSKSEFWTEDQKIKKLKKNSTIIFKKTKIINKEFNPNSLINLEKKLSINKSNFLTNNLGISIISENINRSSKFRFSKIDDFKNFETELNFDGKNFVFFDNKGNLLKFDDNFKILWKKNFYTKNEKKLKPILTLANNSNLLIVFDNISKFYAVNLNSGELIWSKRNINPINSQIKIYDNKIYSVDLNNVLRCFSLKDGTELWKFKSENTFLKSNKRNSLIVNNNVVYFNNSLGDITAVNAKNGRLVWQTPTQGNEVYENAFSLIMSDLVLKNNELIFSNNRNEFFSINVQNGIINWKQEINSKVRPVYYNNLIFTFSNEGYFFVIDSKSGNILRITDIFNIYKKKKREKIEPVGFVLDNKKIYLSTNKGRLLIIDIRTGRTESILKIDNEKISRPFVFDKKLLLIKNNSIIRLN